MITRSVFQLCRATWMGPWSNSCSLLPVCCLSQVWVCWFQRALFLRAGCMRCMWLCTGRTAWGGCVLRVSISFPLCVLPCCHYFLFISSDVWLFLLPFCFSLSVLLCLSPGQYLFRPVLYGCVGSLSQCDMGLGCTAWDESLLFIVYPCTPSLGDSFSWGQLMLQNSDIHARNTIPKQQS